MLLPKVSVVFSEGCSIASTLSHRLDTMESMCQVRSSPVLESWDELTDVCRGADVVFLLSALDLDLSQQDPSELQAFNAGVNRVIECCQECGVGSLVFTSSSRVVANLKGIDFIGENHPFVTEQEDRTAHAIAVAEAEVLKARNCFVMDHVEGLNIGAIKPLSGLVSDNELDLFRLTSGTQNLAGSSCLYTCSLRPSTIYGTGQDRSLKRALGLVGYGLNRLALGPQNVKRDMVHADNLVEAYLLAGEKLMAAHSGGGQANWGRRGPVCSGQAYFVTDGEPCNPQNFWDGILDGLDFPTSKLMRVPKVVAYGSAWLAEAACKVGLTSKPLLNRYEVRLMTENCTYSIERARKDLGYEPSIDPCTAMRSTVQSLRRDGMGRHTILSPPPLFWLCSPLGIWLATLAGFKAPCPTALMPLAEGARMVGLLLFHKVIIIQAICWLAYIIHVLEGVYAFRLAQEAGHRDTAPLWFLQTFIIGYPSLRLIKRLVL